MKVNRVVYASGKQAWRENARADGEGGLLVRGWYVYKQGKGRFGPFKTEKQANDFAGND